MSFGGGGSGGGSIGSATDVALDTLVDGNLLTFNNTDKKWENSTQLSSVKAVCVYNGSAYPARPAGYGSVEWIGPVDPGSAALDNDTWVNTAA